MKLRHHQHVEHDHRRQGQDHRPDAERPKDVLGGKPLFFREWVIFRIHDAPAFLALAGYRYASNFKKPVAISRAFDHRCYRGLTTGAPPEVRQLPIRRPVPRLNQGSLRVPDAVQPSHGDAEHRPVTLFRRSGTHERMTGMWTPDQQHTTPQARHGAPHPGTKSRTNRITESRVRKKAGLVRARLEVLAT